MIESMSELRLYLPDTTEASENKERRQFERYTVPAQSVLIHNLRATLLDESVRGLGLMVDDISDVPPVGTEVEIEMPDTTFPTRGRVMYVKPMTPGKWRIGIELVESYLPGALPLTSEFYDSH
jgi:hypothetical protein